MSFLDRFSVWEILVGLVLILVFNTVLFKFLVDWNQSQPLDEGESLATPPGSGSIAADALDSTSSFATSVPLPNRPRRRKHLQPAEVPAAAPAPGVETRPETVAVQDQPPVEALPQDRPPSPPSEEPVSARAEEPALSVPAEEAPRPAITFASEPAAPPEPVPEPHVLAAPIEPAPEPFPVIVSEETIPAPPSPPAVPAFAASEPAVPVTGVSLPILLNTALAEPAPEFSTTKTPLKTASEPPAPELSSEETVPPTQETPTRVQDMIPSSDLVLNSDLSAAPATLPASETSAPTPAATPARSVFRRAVTPARLFLTREFSSVRIRSRQMAAPETTATPEPSAATPELAPIPVVAESLEFTSAPAPVEQAAVIPPVEPTILRSSEPATSAEAPLPALVVEPAAPEPVVIPAAEVEPVVEATPHVSPGEPSHPAATEPTAGLTLLPVAPEPAPEPALEAPSAPAVPESSSFAAVPAGSESKPEPEPAAEILPAAPVEAAEAPGPVAPAAVAETEVPAPALDAPTPEPPETVPVVDIAPEPANLPPPAPEEQSVHPEPIVTQPIAPFIPIPNMATVQPVTGERATAQLTLSLEVSSLQLTPAFRLGSVQLRPLSNVVSLQLGAGVGPQPAANPLAANISFEIQSVQTGSDGQIQSLVLKPLSQARADTTPQPRLQVDTVQLTRGTENAPIQITPAQATSTAVQLLTTYAIAGIDFTPNFEIGTMRLEPSTRTVMLRLNQPGGTELPPAFEIANVQVGGDGQISLLQLTPTTL